jgi:hypothetical protein
MSNPTCFHLSASSIAAFKACPTRYRLGYREGLRLADDTDAQRVGTNWHKLHEVYQNAYRDRLAELPDGPDLDPADDAHETALSAAVDHLNLFYADTPMPSTKAVEEWEIERQVLTTSFIGYLWYWQSDPIESIESELAFDLPLHAPRTGLPLLTSDVLRVGKIDHVVSWHGMIGNMERKSTSRSIDADSDYWDKAKKDTQVSMYALAFNDMAQAGMLPESVTAHPDYDKARLGNTLYDVWHKPTIKPSKLTQADTAKILEQAWNSGEATYYDTSFDVKLDDFDENQKPHTILIDGQQAEVEFGKSGKPAIRETPAMYAARLLADIQERPEFYFQRREIARTDQEIRRFRVELFNIYQAQRMYDTTGCWFENEQQCRATFPCQYIPVCYGPGADSVCDGETTPPGFKRIFTDVTVDGANLNEGE